MARARALAVGFDGLCLRQPGEEFDFDGAPGDWFEYLDKKDHDAAARKHAEEKVKQQRATIEAQVRAEDEARIRLEIQAKLRAEIEAGVRADIKAKLEAAGKNDASELV